MEEPTCIGCRALLQRALFTAAIHQRNRYRRGEITAAQLQGQREAFEARLRALASPPRVMPEYEHLAQHL